MNRTFLSRLACAATSRFAAGLRGGWPSRLAPALALAALLLPGMQSARAEGSRNLHPAGQTDAQSARGTMNLYGQTYFPGAVVSSNQFLYVYAQKDEYILLGSRNRTANNTGAIRIFASAGGSGNFGNKGSETVPANNTAEFTCSSGTTGLIANRTQELAGPRSVSGATGGNANRWTPCAYQVPTTGIYGVVFSTSSGANGSSIDTPTTSADGVTAWDVTVRSSDTASLNDINGRLFTYAWTVDTGGNNSSSDLTSRSRRIATQLYYVSLDGYRYKQEFRGVDPYRAAFYANSRGFIDTDGAALYRDFRGGSHTVTGGRSVAVGITVQRPEYPIFFSDITPGTPIGAEANRVLSALSIPLVPPTPILSNPDFVGNLGGSTSTVAAGGVFTFDTVNTMTYEIVIKRGAVPAAPAPGSDPNHPTGCVDDYDPANLCNRVLTGVALTGSHTVLWNGLDNAAFAFPAGNYPFQIVGRNGEIHFPIADIEGNVNGGPTLTKLNGGTPGDTTVYFDDRGYQAANGQLVGALNDRLCGASNTQAEPVPRHNLMGIDSNAHTGSGVSALYYRRWGTNHTSNPGTDCGSNTQFFGDAKGLDLWALEKSDSFVLPIEIVPPTSNVDVGTMVSVTPAVLAGDSAFGTFVFTNAGSTQANGVTYAVTLGNPAVPATCPASVNFTMVPTGVTATYNPAPACTITFAGMPTSLNAGQMLTFNFNYVVLPSNPGPIPITTTIGAANETCSGAGCAPNTATAQTVVAKPVVSVVKSSDPVAGSAVNVGDTITYTLSVTIQNAPLTATLSLSDTLGVGLTFASVTNAHASFSCSGSLSCTLPIGTAIGTYTVEYTATVNASAGGSVANNVTATGGGGDNPPTCTTCTVTHTLPVADMSPAFGGLPSVLAPGQVVNGATLTCTNAGPGVAAAATCVPTVDAGTISNLVCVPNPPTNVSVGGSIVCTFDYTAPGTPGGSNTPETGVTFTGTTGATNDSNSGNNTTTQPAVIIDAVDDDFSGTPINGGTGGTTPPVVGNDTVGADPAVIGTNVSLTPGTPSNPLLMMDPTTGIITVPPLVPPGTYTYPYTICVIPATAPPTCETATATVVVTEAPAMTIVKSVTSGAGPYAEGQTITYDLVVTNTGNVAMTAVTVSDPNAVLGACVPVALPGTLGAGATTTCPATHVVTAADVTAGSVVNAATATGTPPSGNPITTPPSTVTSPTAAPGLTIVKTVTSGAGPYALGDTITYSLVVENTGGLPLTGVTVSDPNAVVGACAPIALPGTLGAGATTTCPATHVVTAADVTAGSVVNSATATGTPPATPGNPTPPPVTTPPSTVTSPVGEPGLSIVKTVTSGPGPYALGDTITYDLVVANPGTLPMSNVTVSDPNAVLGACAPIALPGTLAGGATTTCPATHVVTAADVTAGSVVNSATATGTPPATPGNPTPPPVTTPPSTVTSPVGEPGLTLVKTVTSGAGPYALGDTITYDLVVANPGTLPMSNVTVSDPNAVLGACAPIALPGTLAGGATTTCPATHVVTAADVTAGSVVNSATATGTPPSTPGNPTPPPVTTPPSTVTSPVGEPGLTLVKTVTSGAGPYALGDTITYDLVVANPGTLPMSNVTVSDPNAVLGACAPIALPGTLAGGATTTCPATHVVTAADVTAGSVVNSATATGTPPATPGNPTPPPVTTPPSTVTSPVGEPGLTIVKTVTSGAGPYALGDTITYSLVVENPGTLPMANVTVSDPNAVLGACAPIALPGTLAGGATTTCPATHVVTAADVTAGSVVNSATATGTPPSTPGNPTPPPVTTPPSTVTSPVGEPGLTLVKTVTSGAGPYALGDTITYSLVVENPGTLPMSNVTVSDPNAVLGACAPIALPGTLAGGATTTCPATHVVTAADVTAGSVVNSATATGTPPATPGNPTPPPVTTPPSTVTSPVGEPGLSIVKTVTSGPGPYALGDTITYDLVVANPGTLPMSNVTVSDPNAVLGACAPIALPGTLAAGATTTCPATHVVTAADVTAGSVVNSATATGTPPSTPGNPTPPPVTTPPSTVTSPVGEPGLTLVKTVTSGAGPYALGDTITYSLVVENPGTLPMSNVTVSDPNAVLGACAPIALPGTLAAGATTTCPATHVVTAADVTAGSVVNSATATGTPPATPGNPTPPPVTTPPSTVTSPVGEPGLSIVKTVTSGPGPYALGDTITYDLVVANPGTLPMANVTVSDPNAVLGACAPIALPGTLAGGATTTCPATHVVTAADVTAGSVVNAATATGTPPATPGNPTPPPVTTPPSTVTSPVGEPGLTLVKTVTSGPGPYALGDTITYDLVVANPGTLPMSNVTVSDPNAVLGACAPIALPGTLAGGATTTCPATHVVTAADVTAGSVVNAATATGTPPATPGNPTPPPVTTPPSTVTSPVGEPGLTLVKTVTSGAGPYALGDTITYDLVVANPGTLPMSNVTVSDPNAVLGACAPIALPGTLAGGATTTCPATHVVTAADVTAGSVVNSATATGTPPATPGNPTPPPVTTPPSTVTSPVGEPGLTLVKTVTSGPGPYALGDTITYDLVVANPGTLPMSNVTVSDPNAVLGACAPIALPGTLAGGATTTCPATHVVTAADVTAGSVVNSATATGTPPSTPGNPTPPPVTTPPSTVTSPVAAPGLSIVKTGPAITQAGQQIVFTIVVTNAGPVVANGVTVTDPTPAGLTFVSNAGDCTTAFPCALGTMAVGETRTITVTLMVPTAYAGPNPIINTATVSSTSTTDTSSSTASVPLAVAAPPRLIPANAPWALLLMALSTLLVGAGAMGRFRS